MLSPLRCAAAGACALRYGGAIQTIPASPQRAQHRGDGVAWGLLAVGVSLLAAPLSFLVTSWAESIPVLWAADVLLPLIVIGLAV